MYLPMKKEDIQIVFVKNDHLFPTGEKFEGFVTHDNKLEKNFHFVFKKSLFSL